MATGVTSWSTTAATNATVDANVDWSEGMAPSSVNDSARALMASVALYRDDIAGSLVSGGSSTAYTVTTNQGFASLSALNGQTLTIRFNATNGANPTLSVDGLTARSIQMDITNNVPTGAIRANSVHRVTYNNAQACFIVHGGHSLVPPGVISPYGGSAAPNGYLLCDGSAVSRTTYADLFAAIGTAFGTGNGSTTFNVPDLNGRVPVGKDNAGGNNTNRITSAVAGFDGDTLGAAGGDQRVQTHNHTLTDPGHAHTLKASSSLALTNEPSANALAKPGNEIYRNAAPDVNMQTGSIATNTTGITLADFGAGSSQNVQPSLVVNYIIKI